MGSTEVHGEIDPTRLQSQLRLRYELARLRRAVVGFAPLFVIVAMAAYFSHRPVSAMLFGMLEFTLGVFMLWYGQGVQKAVLPGVVAGLIPLSFALCANYMHACGSGHCNTLCLPACTAGGVFAGLLVAFFGMRRKAPASYWLCASGLTILTGAMGCSCIGYSGILGLAGGLSIGVIPGLLRNAVRTPRR